MQTIRLRRAVCCGRPHYVIDPTGEAYDLPDRFTVDSTSLILAGRRIDIWESPCGRPMLVDDALEIETLDKHIPVRIIYS